jgi:hypothetical protein
MYRVIVIVSGALAVAACSSTPDWMSTESLKPSPITDTVRFESKPSGAEAKTSNGQTCRTPCELALPINAPLSVTFTLNGYLPETENIEPISATGLPTQLRPNPVVAELTPAPPPPPPKLVKKPKSKKKPSATSAAKPAAKPAAKRVRPKPAAATTAAPAPITVAPAQQQPPSPAR